jgi:hypothetical protein
VPTGSASREQGFSLLESLIACTLLTVGLLSLAQLMTVAASLNESSRHGTLAAVLAAQKVEELRALVDQAPGVDFIDSLGNPLAPSGGGLPARTAYVRRWTVDPLDVDSAASVIEVIVTRAPGRTGPGSPAIRIIAVRSKKAA